jgi:hypothetical protein
MARYPFPWDIFFRLALDLPAGRRSLPADTALMVSRMRPPPEVSGLRYLPAAGPAVIAANHYQRRGLWIAWPGAVITDAVARRRGPDPPLHWLVTGGLRWRQWANKGPEVPLTRTLLAAVAQTYAMAPLPLDGAADRARALRRWVGWLEQGHAGAVFPEGLAGRSDALGPPEPGFDSLCRVLGTKGIPLLPCAIFERGEVLHVEFGAPLPPSSQRRSQDVMRAIADMLPVERRGLMGPDPRNQ